MILITKLTHIQNNNPGKIEIVIYGYVMVIFMYVVLTAQVSMRENKKGTATTGLNFPAKPAVNLATIKPIVNQQAKEPTKVTNKPVVSTIAMAESMTTMSVNILLNLVWRGTVNGRSSVIMESPSNSQRWKR